MCLLNGFLRLTCVFVMNFRDVVCLSLLDFSETDALLKMTRVTSPAEFQRMVLTYGCGSKPR